MPTVFNLAQHGSGTYAGHNVLVALGFAAGAVSITQTDASDCARPPATKGKQKKAAAPAAKKKKAGPELSAIEAARWQQYFEHIVRPAYLSSTLSVSQLAHTPSSKGAQRVSNPGIFGFLSHFCRYTRVYPGILWF